MNELLLRRQMRMFRAAGMETGNAQRICTNAAVNGMLSVYEAYAKEESIQVEICADIAENIVVRDIDMAAILVNVFENAIWECVMSGRDDAWIHLLITQNKGKVVIRCENTCGSKPMQRECAEDWDRKAESVRKAVGYYNGEMERATQQGVTVSKILLDIPLQ